MSLISHARGTRPVLAALSVFLLFVVGACGSSDPKPSANTQTSTSGSTTSSAGEGARTSTTAASTAGTLVEITVTGGQVAGGVSRAHIDLGESVTIRVTSDVTEEIHVHGYDLKGDLTPGVPVELTFIADIPGVFDVELEHSGLKVAELQVA